MEQNAAYVLEVEDVSEFLLIQSFRVVDAAVRVGKADHLGAETHRLLGCELGHVARAGDKHGLAFE